MKVTKKDENNLRLAYRHFRRFEIAMARVKAPVASACEEDCGVSDFALLLEDGGTEDGWVKQILGCIERYKDPVQTP